MRMLDKFTKKEDRMCKIAFKNADMKQDDIAKVLSVSRRVVSRPLKEQSDSIRKRLVGWLVLLLNVPSQQLWSLRDGQFT